MSPTVVLLTDFGHLDPYVGQVKGTVLRYAPEAVLVDLCHEITPHNVTQAAFILQSSYQHFPENSIFVCVVDPGVGTTRHLLLAQLGTQFFLAPDNGLLAFLAPAQPAWWTLTKLPEAPSATFHGRDIFAPVAARLALGVPPGDLALPMLATSVTPLPPPPLTVSQEEIICVALHVDRFGNCLLNLPIPSMPEAKQWTCNGQPVTMVSTYADLAPGQTGLLPGSQGMMELAMNQACAAKTLNIIPGATVRLTSCHAPAD